MTFQTKKVQIFAQIFQITSTGQVFEDADNLRVVKKPIPVPGLVLLTALGKFAGVFNVNRREGIKILSVTLRTRFRVNPN